MKKKKRIYLHNSNQYFDIETKRITVEDIILITVDPQVLNLDTCRELYDIFTKLFEKNTIIVTVKGIEVDKQN